MNTRRLLLITVLSCLVTACPLLDEEDPTVPEGPPGGSTGLLPGDVVEADGLLNTPEGIAGTLYSAAADCGWQTSASIPGGWQPVTVSNDGCTQWIPSTWAILGVTNAAAFSPDLARHIYAFTLVNPLPTGYQWTALEVVDFFLDSVAVEFGVVRPSLLWKQESDITPLEIVDAAFAFWMDGVPLVGSLRVNFAGCKGGECYALIMGYWVPEENLAQVICDITQIDASMKCPGQSTCVDPNCNSWCLHLGSTGGSCSGKDCRCD